ncbi:MAG: septum formation protein Maf [bacterium]|nr:septum formation protein Maf [bacterium]
MILERLDSVVLASRSPRRVDLLRSLGLDVVVRPSAYDEGEVAGLEPRELAVHHAREKARDVARSLDEGAPLVVAADTIVEIDGRLFGKPAGTAEAAQMLRTLSGRTHQVHTGYCLRDRRAGERSGCVTSDVTFVTLREEQIEEYIASGEPMDKAGAYGIQGRGALLVDRVAGDFYAIMGLPVATLARECEALGYRLL